MAGPSVLSRLAARALDLVFPPRCVGCGAFGNTVCPACVAAMPRARPPRCRVCWMPGPDVCLRCRKSPPAFEGARSVFVYEGPVREAVQALKYRGVAALAAPMASLMARYLREEPPGADFLVPVPLHSLRRRLRGYNQSELLARELSAGLGLPLAARALARQRSTPPQARAAGESERHANVAGAFEGRRADVEGRKVLLVDDVMTTGATLDACALALREAGAARVHALTFARED